MPNNGVGVHERYALLCSHVSTIFCFSKVYIYMIEFVRDVISCHASLFFLCLREIDITDTKLVSTREIHTNQS